MKKILVLGVGALGSVIAELLVRAGVQRLILMDGDTLKVGNLCRHTLDLDEVGRNKAAGMRRRLGRISPHVEVHAVERHFPPNGDEDLAHVQDCDVILDCTGDDELLSRLERFPWKEERLFVSVSLGFRAGRLFCFSAQRERFPLTLFREEIGPWLQLEQSEARGEEFPREGLGCWHPVFPARADDVWGLAAAAVKHLEAITGSSARRPPLTVYEQVFDDGFAGIRQVPTEPPNA